ncbi:IbpA Molecular chaperone (small heat shock protein) [uncultured Caudovirales phage]|uniref:IbpA Molecular chaperone (Small heat shock protein) n=1 Tax=uncultured Caudovirales phage TaxID=2100421 RepID=A0A6J5T9S0_9CAUD|nr:IbpA Molecular chaperone (small heat shock protein) [uncultured Caudovirales phage]
MSNKLFPYSQFGIGFDRMFEELDRLMAVGGQSNGGYPPFNVEKLEGNKHRITMAVAGFAENEIDITHQDNVLVVKGEKSDKSTSNFIYRGIAKRNFRREFVLADQVEVKTASLKDGMLVIDFEQLMPDEYLPKKIPLTKE